MAGIKAVRQALADQITELTGLECHSRMHDQITVPCAAILPGVPYAKYGITLGEPTLQGPIGQQLPVPTELNLAVAIIMSRAPSLQDAQDSVDEYLGLEPSDDVVSVPLAILRDPTLGGLVEYCEPTTVVAYGDIEVAGQAYFHGRLGVHISVTQDLGVF